MKRMISIHAPISRRCVAVIRSRTKKLLREQITRSLAAKENAMLACSALKRAYRERLRVSGNVKFVFLRGDYALIENQLRRRRGHFMNPELLQSQFADLDEPQPNEDVLTIDLGQSPQELVEEIKAKLNLRTTAS